METDGIAKRRDNKRVRQRRKRSQRRSRTNNATTLMRKFGSGRLMVAAVLAVADGERVGARNSGHLRGGDAGQDDLQYERVGPQTPYKRPQSARAKS
jgi:hypothetical protein